MITSSASSDPCHDKDSRRVIESSEGHRELGGSGRVLSEGQGEISLTGGYSKGSYRLTCTAQPVHGGKRRDSPEEGVPSAIINLMQVIDHKPNNQIETQYSDIIFGTLEWLGVTSS